MSQTLSPDTTCHNCGAPNPTPSFRACPDCRHYWRTQSRKPDGPTARLETAQNAIRLALPVMREDLRVMVECNCECLVDADTPPRPRTMETHMRPYAEACRAAILACTAALDTPPKHDGQPAWLDDVINGRIKL